MDNFIQFLKDRKHTIISIVLLGGYVGNVLMKEMPLDIVTILKVFVFWCIADYYAWAVGKEK